MHRHADTLIVATPYSMYINVHQYTMNDWLYIDAHHRSLLQKSPMKEMIFSMYTNVHQYTMNEATMTVHVNMYSATSTLLQVATV